MVLPFYIVDVFAEKRFTGNQLAVILDTTGLSDNLMQDIAREMHFSETTFINPASKGGNHYAVRIFTPEHEVPFAGHPVLGSAYVIWQEMMGCQSDEITLDLSAGHITVSFSLETKESPLIWMRQNQPVFTRKFDPLELATVLSLPVYAIDSRFPVEEVSTGLPFIIVPLVTRECVRSAHINREAYDDLIAETEAKAIHIFCSEPYHPENTLNARMFGDYYGVPEDPATGSANGCLAAYLVRNRYLKDPPPVIRIEQGYEINRPSLVWTRTVSNGDNIDVEVGGSVILIAKGELICP